MEFWVRSNQRQRVLILFEQPNVVFKCFQYNHYHPLKSHQSSFWGFWYYTSLARRKCWTYRSIYWFMADWAFVKMLMLISKKDWDIGQETVWFQYHFVRNWQNHFLNGKVPSVEGQMQLETPSVMSLSVQLSGCWKNQFPYTHSLWSHFHPFWWNSMLYHPFVYRHCFCCWSWQSERPLRGLPMCAKYVHCI